MMYLRIEWADAVWNPITSLWKKGRKLLRMTRDSVAFQWFKEKLINAQGHITVVYPFHHFLYWAKKLTYAVLGKPQTISENKWVYGDGKVVHFVLGDSPYCDYFLRGLNPGQIIICDGFVTDDFLGVQRKEVDNDA